jgi:D-aminoacyl-tRNA deacylase
LISLDYDDHQIHAASQRLEGKRGACQMRDSIKRAVYFFCCDMAIDPVARRVFDASTRLITLETLPLTVDGYPVRYFEDVQGHQYVYVRTSDVVSHDYPRYLPVLNEYFAEFDFAGVINWHAGQNAPDRILTVHTTGDVVSGHFGAAHPVYTRNLMLSLEANRRGLELDDFTVTTEATHWSGIVYGGNPELIPCYPVPLVDVEIGSSPTSWSHAVAIEVVAKSLPNVFNKSGDRVRTLLCVGGIHIEPSFAAAVLREDPAYPLAVAHIFANHWIVSGGYGDESGLARFELGARSVLGSIDGIVYHDSIKSPYKNQTRLLGEKLGVPIFKHRALTRPAELPLW